jgi:glycosyltransferase involved in cell wall biosynthesis
VQLGHAFKELGDLDRAGLHYLAVLEQTPTDDDLHLQIGHLEKLKGDRQEAAAYYRKAAELNPDNNDAMVEYHSLAGKLGLPPLPPSSIFDGRPPAGTEKECTGPANRETSDDRQGGNQGLSSITHRIRDVPFDVLKRAKEATASRVSYETTRRPKVLFVSDSLGTPIHARGIYYYSTALAEILRNIDFEITLVVEKTPGYGLTRHTPKSTLSSVSLDVYQSAEINRYFNEKIFSFPWKYENRWFQNLVEKWPSLVRIGQRVCSAVSPRHSAIVNNLSNRIDFRPYRGRHLMKFDRFLYIDRFYSSSMERAVNDLDPPAVSAAGYDLVVIDTPHYVRVKNIARWRVFSVIHDLIPLHDALNGEGWRRIFLSKLRATLALRGNLIFVSEYSRSSFRAVFPRHAVRRHVVLYPSIPTEWVERATPAKPRVKSTYMSTIGRDRLRMRREQIQARAARLTDNQNTHDNLVKQLESSLPAWNGSLPYFATATSDEPRKNIQIFAKIAPRFIGKANFVIIGQVHGNHYMNHEPELYPNLHFTGYLDDEHKTDLFGHAAGVIFPSFSEGFGIPIVEGAMFDVPVICSNLKVFHEVTKNLALYFDPHNPDELAERVNEVLASPAAYTESARQLRELVLKRFSQDAMRRRFEQTLSEIGILTRPMNLDLSVVSGTAVAD